MNELLSPRKRITLFLALVVAYLVVFNASTFLLYLRARSFLEDTLAERLKSIAVTAARALEGTGTDSLAQTALLNYGLLHQVRSENLLSNMVILDHRGRTILDLSNLSETFEKSPLLELDYSAVTLAQSGFTASTRLYRSGDTYLKSAYAPIHGREGEVIGILGVEAGAGFFQELRSLGRAIIGIDAASLGLIVLIGFLFYRQSRSLDRAREAVLRSENLSTMGRMVAGIAHEIRNPLGIIKTSAERIRTKYGIEDEVLAYIPEEVDKLNRILTGYLSFARAESQPHFLYPLQKIIAKSLRIVADQIAAKGIQLKRTMPEREVMISCDPNRLQQAFLNVLLNAVQAVEERGMIEVTVSVERGKAVLSVKDDGCGIDQKMIREVVRPFFTTKKEGSGLGLCIVNNIMEEHGGRLSIESSEGVGTEVSMHLPLAGKGEGKKARDESESRPEGGPIARRKREDDG